VGVTALNSSQYGSALGAPAPPQPATIEAQPESLGEYLQGQQTLNSPYKLRMQVNSTCQLLCDPKVLSGDDVAAFREKVNQDYYVHWMIDNLPAAARNFFTDGEYHRLGFPVGEMATDGESLAVFNHARMFISVHTEPGEFDGWRVVGFEVVPISVEQVLTTRADGSRALGDCDSATGYTTAAQSHPMFVDGPQAKQRVELAFSYDVFWVPSDVKWASRWDVYLSMGDGAANDDVHWFAIVNAAVIAVFLTGLVALILWRAIHRDVTRYNRVATEEEKAEDREDTGWKLVHTDVFRPPTTAPLAFAVMTGVGAQVSCMSLVVILFAALGFLNPANRGSLVTGVIVLFCLLGIVAGYAAARNHRLFDGKQWHRTTVLTALAFPGFCAVVLLTLNTMAWASQSTNAVPFGTLLAVLTLWLAVSVPLTFLGAYFGFKAPKPDLPTRVGAYPRVIPAQPWYLHPAFSMAVGGVLPFGAVFVELYFILGSIWLDRYYYVFGFLLLVAIILVITCAEIAIVLVYFQLCSEDYRWWWRSWLIPGASSIYLALYATYYFSTALTIMGGVSVALYFGYTLLAAVAFFLVTGCVGYLATFVFVWRIYDAVKVD